MNTILLALLAASFLRDFHAYYGVLIVTLVAAFAVCDRAWRAESWSRQRARVLIVTLIIALIVIAPTLLEIYLRRITAPSEHIHDGAIQTEQAIYFLWAGKNPYVENYTQTPMANWFAYFDLPPRDNPALDYLPYLPATFIAPMPVAWFAQSAFGFFDLRMYHLIWFGALAFGLLALPENWEHKLGLLITISLQPLFVPFVIEGRNDIVVLGALTLTWLLLARGRITLSALLLGFACALKPTAWFAAPFFFAHLWFTRARDWKWIARVAALPCASVAALFIAPFIVWDARAFIEDALWYQSTGYQIWGQGLSPLLLALNILPHKDAPFPFTLIQFLIGALALIFLLRWQRRAPTLRRMIAATATLGFVVGVVGRAFIDNHIGFMLSLGLIAWWVE